MVCLRPTHAGHSLSLCRKPLAAIAAILAGAAVACGGAPQPAASSLPPINLDRVSRIPPSAVKMTPETDGSPPVMLSSEFEQPIPLLGLINTAGAEDSPFYSLDENSLYFFFTPDVKVPVEQQVSDGVTGIYRSPWGGGEWLRPERILLAEPGKAAGDGCEFVLGDVMWFCSVREGYTGVNWFTAESQAGAWRNWQPAEFDPAYQVGELHINRDGTQLYFGSERPGGEGGLDIWVSTLAGEEWLEPIPVSIVNTADSEGWPALNAAEDELWFTRNYGIWRSMKVNGEWQEAELIVSPLAGEPTFDIAGNLYFVHHFFTGDTMIEADIYVAFRK